MRLRTRFHAQHPAGKALAIATTAVLCTIIALACRSLPGTSIAMNRLDDVLYDALYKLRPTEDRTRGDVVVVTLDEGSIQALAKQGILWPVQRDWWGLTVELLQRCGAKVVAFDLIFPQPSVYRKYEDDDQQFADALDAAQIPVVMAVMADPPAARASGSAPGDFAVPVRRPPIFGAVNVKEKLIRVFDPIVNGVPSLASRAAALVGAPSRDWSARPFRLHFYGPHAGRDGRPVTYRYVPAQSVFAAARKLQRGKPLAECGIDPDLFRGKVVLIGYTAALLYDLKSSPLSEICPGVEIQATAIDNLLQDRHVLLTGAVALALITAAGAALAAMGAIAPRRVSLKGLGGAMALLLLAGLALAGFLGREIHWLPLAAPLLAWFLATLAALSWSYFTEGRQRRQIVRAFSQVLSPELVARIERDPRQLDPGGERREMTVMFTDLAGFTSLTEKLDNHALVELLNFYFEQMAPLVLEGLGTLDKYIGDSIMSFWNAPVAQPDHAALACRAALRMAQREREIQPHFRSRGAKDLLTRIGINTGPMIVGFTGSGKRLSYSVLGDSVNLGSRLESANKLYGSQILVSETTAGLVKDRFLLRRLDVLRVVGKEQPIAVYELIAEGPGDDRRRRLARLYESALEHYQGQRWDDADTRLAELAEAFPGDPPAAALSRRIAAFRRDPPPVGWDGVWIAQGK
jgi:adenylate cyclase